MKPRVAWFASTKADSLSRYASDCYIPALQGVFEIIRFVRDAECQEMDGVHPFGNAYEMHRKEPFSAFIYCVERDLCSDFAWAGVGILPGIVLMLEDFAPPQKPWLFQSQYLETEKIIAGATLPIDLRDVEPYPVDAEVRAALLATKIIATSEEMLERIPVTAQKKCAVVPMPAQCPAWQPSSLHRFQIASCTPVNEDFLLTKLFQSLRRLEGDISLLWLTSNECEVESLRKKIGDWDLTSKVTLHTRPKNIENWRSALLQSSVAIHLQSWGRATLEPYLGTSLTSGIPTVVTNFGVGRLLPSALAITLQVGMSCAQQLTGVLAALMRESNWPADQQRALALSRYSLEANTYEIKALLSQEVLRRAPLENNLNKRRAEVRKAWLEEIKSQLGQTEYGKSFSDVHTFLAEL